MYVPRTLEAFFSRADEQFPILLIVGPRQVGKTTFLQHISEAGRTYVTLDDPNLVMLAKEDPKLFLERFPPPVLIDEIQYAPELLPIIKMSVDRNRKAGQYWLTGAQQFHLMKGVSESLAGRVGIVNLLGLSLKEQLNFGAQVRPFLPTLQFFQDGENNSIQIGLKEVFRHIWRGSFPALSLNSAMDRDLFFSSYVQTYIQRDVRDLAKVGDEQSFLRFLRTTAARTGQLLNFADLARDCDVSAPTAKSWLSILQTSGLIYLLEPFHSNFTKRLIKTPKLYFLDTGLCSYLTDWSSPETLEAGAMNGAIFETFVVSEIIKSYWHNGKHAPIFYYRDKDKKELDLLISQDQTLYPIEIKKSASPKKEFIQSFSVLESGKF